VSKYYGMNADGSTYEMADVIEWAKMLEGDRRIAWDEIGPQTVSTIFLGLDYSFGNGPLQLFETMIFGGPYDGEMNRYENVDAARAGHEAMCKKAWSALS
jgi:hypothetical protein